MEIFLAFVQAHGLTAIALAAAWGLLKYYIGKDITETRAGITAAQNLHSQLKTYVENCEEEFRDTLRAHEKELAMIKQEANHLSGDIKASIARIEANLAEHTRKEEIYQRDMTAFMGYVYRQVGTGDSTLLKEGK